MTELLTAAQMRAIERAAIETGEVTGLELMERAGTCVVEAILEEWPEYETAPHRAAILCGPGNNGGDGFVVARLLKIRGWEVDVFLFGEAGKLPPDASANYLAWLELGTVQDIFDCRDTKLLVGQNKTAPVWAPPVFETWEDTVVIDALFGIGMDRPVDERLRELIRDVERLSGSKRKVAIDMPSGLHADTGVFVEFAPAEMKEATDAVAYVPIKANLTVTFHRPKRGHMMRDGLNSCGRLVVADIGLEGAGEPHEEKSNVELVAPRHKSTQKGRQGGDGSILSQIDPSVIQKLGEGHKFSHGHALILSGGHGRTGAARLAARGALRIGAGLVTLASPRSAMYENAAHLSAIMLAQIDGAHGVIELLEDERITALCLGPGLGRGMDTQAVVIAALKGLRPTVLDADALTRFERNPQVLFDLLHDRCVLTPHGGEFAKLFPDLAEKLAAAAATGPAYSKVDATREAAARAGCVVLYKGAETVIAAPDGCSCVNAAKYERAAPWLATAGSGDVLAGFITGLLARGRSPMQAAETGARLHVDAALEFGPGLIAEDLPEQLPALFRRLKI